MNAHLAAKAVVPSLGEPPPGVESDFSNPGYSNVIRGLSIALIVFNTLFTAGRVYTRSVILRQFGWDDGFCVFSWMTTTIQLALNITVLKYGFGRHVWDIPVTTAPKLFEILFVIEEFCDAVYLPIKLTFLFTYMRIFGGTRTTRYFILGGVVVCVLFYVVDFFWDLFKCSPIAKSWDPFLDGKCANTFVPGASTGIFNTISDIYILVLPIPMVIRLNTSMRRKIKLIAIFGVGAFAAVTSIVRLAETIRQVNNPDFTYALGTVSIWANLEYSIGLMVACSLVFPAAWNRSLREDPLTAYWAVISSTCRSILTLGSGRSRASNSTSAESLGQVEEQKTVRPQERERERV